MWILQLVFKRHEIPVGPHSSFRLQFNVLFPLFLSLFLTAIFKCSQYGGRQERERPCQPITDRDKWGPGIYKACILFQLKSRISQWANYSCPFLLIFPKKNPPLILVIIYFWGLLKFKDKLLLQFYRC